MKRTSRTILLLLLLWIPVLSAQSTPKGVLVTVYGLEPGQSPNLRDLSGLKKISQFRASSFDVPLQESQNGFPGVWMKNEWFVLACGEKLYFNDPRDYRFSLTSDDGSLLLIDGFAVIDNSGIHGSTRREGTINLSEGFHDVEILYFQGPGRHLSFQVEIEEEGQFRIWDLDRYKRPFQFEGTAVDRETGYPLNASVRVSFPERTNASLAFNTDPATGEFLFKLPPSGWYTLSVDAEGYLPYRTTKFIRNSSAEKKKISLQPLEFTLKGSVADAETGRVISGLLLRIRPPAGEGEEFLAKTDEKGAFNIRLPAGRDFLVKAEARGYMYFSETFRYDPAIFRQTRIVRTNIFLTPLKVGENFTLTSVYFNPNQAEIRKDSLRALEDLAGLLKDNPHIRLLIKGHISVDAGGQLDMMELSRNRAGSVRNHLLSRGIDRSRLEIQGFGDTRPIADNSTAEGRSRNQRVEFEVIR